ncbi:transglycosylase domain-containing protein [Sphingomonas sp. DT-207]|uniref:transglycosylase domain-containing protein n=1 Tax=Sphingomonas sp. DT-207 TaxID=3396167 RepID=UPI003F53EC9A
MTPEPAIEVRGAGHLAEPERSRGFFRRSPPPPPPPQEPEEPELAGGDAGPPPRARNYWRWVTRGIGALIILFVLAVAWLALTAPLSKSLQPPAPPSITLLASDGTPIARRGAVIADPVDAAKLPDHVRDAFVAIEDRRFYGHLGVDPRGILRAMIHNATSDGGSQGGSTITQQLAKNAFLTQDRTITRKMREVLIAFWLEAWLSKEEILSRYLSNVYFGDNVYGLRAAARHYFSTDPEDLTISQATLLAGLVQAPSRLAPTGNLKGARERQKLVVGAMVDAGLLSEAEGDGVRPAVLKVAKSKELPNGTYFADWVLPQARDRAGGVSTEQTVRTTLDSGIQRAAERAVAAAGLRQSQVALVAMRPDGRVVAMVGGRNYRQSPFNRATQARRQPGSTFKLFVYLAALRSGMSPDTIVDDSPVTIGEWTPANSDGRYAGKITLRQAFAKSSNVVAARLTAEIGVGRVIRAARDLGISTPIANEASIALGTSGVSLLELTAAYAAVANGSYPVRPKGLSDEEAADDWLALRLGGATRFGARELDDMRSMLASVIEGGTGRSARLPVPAFGKSGTTQDSRDALFVGYAGDLVVGVWLGNDDNSPNPGLSGSGIPARIWRDFMVRALDLKLPPPPPVEEPEDNAMTLDEVLNGVEMFIDGSEIDTDVIRPREGFPEDETPVPVPMEDEGLPPPPGE